MAILRGHFLAITLLPVLPIIPTELLLPLVYSCTRIILHMYSPILLTQPIIIALGITFGQPVRNKMYPNADGNLNAAAIVEVDEIS